MKLLNTTVQNILFLVVIIALAVAIFWLVRGQTQPPQTAQVKLTDTATPLATETPSPTIADTPKPTATDTPLPTTTPTINTLPIVVTISPVITTPYLVFYITPIPGPTFTPTPEASPITNIVTFSDQAQGIKILNEQQITGKSSDTAESCEFDYYSHISWSPDSQNILTSRPNGKSITSGNITLLSTDMWLFSIATQQWEMLIPNAGAGLWSPDGAKILYSTIEDANTLSIFVVARDGKDSNLIAQTTWQYPLSWLQDNSILYFSIATQLWDVFALQKEVEPSEFEPLINNIKSLSSNIQEIQFASNKNWVAYQQETNLVLNNQMEETKLLTTQLSNDPGTIRWSLDGKKLAYVTSSPETPTYSIWIYDTQADTSTQIFENEKFIDRLSWFPNGQILLFESYEGQGTFTIQLINIDGNGSTNLLQANPANPQLSPDGQVMAFFRNCNLWLATLSYSK